MGLVECLRQFNFRLLIIFYFPPLENVANDGEYTWDASSTFTQHSLIAASDYSLMLWTQNPPRQSISGYFSLNSSSSSIKSNAEASGESTDCLKYLGSNGGYYDQTRDTDFIAAISIGGNITNIDTAFDVETLAVGSTSLSWSSWSDDSNSAFQLEGMPIDLISRSTLGMGMVGLNVLQRARNSRIPEMDTVALNLGTDNRVGSVVMGGYDNALIDNNQKAVFSKTSTSGFEVLLTGITYVGSSSESPITSGSASSNIALAYDSPNIQLPAEVLGGLLPLIGSPTFDKDLNGYVYSGTPKTDYSLRFTLEGSDSFSIIVPASSLLATDTPDDNPMTSRTESGRTYLRLSPSSDGHPAYLGRAFLQHVYVISAPPTINKFHMSAIPSPFPITRSLVAASRDSVTIFGVNITKNKPAVGPMVGGILGGLVVIIGGIAAWIFISRRKLNRMSSRSVTDEDKTSSIPSYSYEKGYEFSSTQSTNESSRVTSTGPSSFSRGVSSLPPPRQKLPEPLVRDPESARRPETKRRNSENSTVARVFMGPYSPQVDDMEELQHEIQLQRTATIGRFYSAGRVAKVVPLAGRAAKIEPPPLQIPERANISGSHVRTASIGRVCMPTSVEFSPVSSRRESMKTVGSVDGHVKRRSADSSDKEEMIKEEDEVDKEKGEIRWSNSTKLTNTTDPEESDSSSVFGLDGATDTDSRPSETGNDVQSTPTPHSAVYPQR